MFRPHRSLLLLVAACLAATLPASSADKESPRDGGEGTLIVLNKAEASASLIDLATGRVAATVKTGVGPHEAAVSPDGRLAVASNYGTREAPGSSLTVIDVAGAKAVRTIELGEHRRPHGIAWLPDGKRVAVTAEDSRALLIVNVPDGVVEAAIGTDQDVSHMVVVSSDGDHAYVASIGSGSVTAIDLKARSRVRVVPTGAGAEGITLLPDGRTLWVTNREADTVSVIDTKSLTIVATLKSASFPIRAAATRDGRWVLVSNARSGGLTVFDARTREETRRVAMSLEAAGTEGRLFGERFGKSPVPIGILMHPDGKRAYVANANADVVAVVDLASWTVSGTLLAGREPDGMAYSPLRVPQR
jgi:YVTN family beta-propeller protein